MSSFAIKHPFFILMLCLIIVVVGVTTVARMPVDLFPEIKIPVVVVATFYSGMPPQQIEGDITDTFERFFTLGSNIDHIESRSLTGVSLIKVYFQPGTDPDAAVSEIANLAMADLRRLPQGTLPPVVLKFDASSMPVCLVTLKGKGLTETELHDQGQFNVRNQIANVPGASVPQPYGGKYRQIQFYIDPVKLQATQLSPMDVVRLVNQANTILPSGDLRVGPRDYNIYSNSQLPSVKEMNDVPLKAIGNRVLRFGDIGHAEDASAIQYNVVRVDGQKSVYLPILKQGGNSNTIEIVDGVRERVANLRDIPKNLIANVVFDQSQYVKTGHCQCAARGRYRFVPDGGDDPGLPGIVTGNHLGAAIDSYLLPGRVSTAECDGQHHQHHRFRRAGAGSFPADRQLGGGAGKHLSPSGVGRRCPNRCGRRRSRSGPGGAGGDHHHRDRVFPRGFPLRRQHVFIHRPGPRRSAGLSGVIFGGNVSGAAVLLAIHQIGAGQRSRGRARRRLAAACAGAVQPGIRLHPQEVRRIDRARR